MNKILNKIRIYEKIYLFVLIVFLFFGGLGYKLNKGTSAIEASEDAQMSALLETAHAYYRQGVQNQYDSYKKNLYSSPEDATSQHYTYTVCSGFVFQVYYQTFGIKIPSTTEELLDAAEKYKDNPDYVPIFYKGVDVIYSDDVLGTADTSNYTNLAKQWVDILLPGDIIVVTGHAFMVDSIDYENEIVYIIESGAGGRYSYANHVDKFDENGTIQYRKLTSKLKEYYNRVISNENFIERMAVIRFINNDLSQYIDSKLNLVYKNDDTSVKSLPITNAGQSRIKYSNIDIEKIVKVSDGNNMVSQNILVDLGDTMTYEITIKNNSSFENNPYLDSANEGIDYGSFDVVENIDPRLEVIDTGGGILENNQLKWNYSNLSSNDTITISYTVKIPNDLSLLGEIIISNGLVDNIATSKIESLIGSKLSNEDKSKLLNSFNKLKDNLSFERDFINDIYVDAFGLNLGLSNELSNLDIISYDSSVVSGGKDVLSVKATKVNDTVVSKYIYNNFYGLRINDVNVPDENLVRAILQWNIFSTYELNDRARTLTIDMLDDGDIILVYLGETDTTDENLVNKSYMYIDGKLIRKISSTEFEELSGDSLITFLRNIIGDNYVILKPSISNELRTDVGVLFDSSLIIDEENSYIKYLVLGTTVEELLDMVTIDGGDIHIYNRSGVEKVSSDLLATGDVFKVIVGESVIDEYVFSVLGDSSGDGKLSTMDLAQFRKHLVDWVNPDTGIEFELNGVYSEAFDLNKDGKISVLDLAIMRKKIVGLI